MNKIVLKLSYKNYINVKRNLTYESRSNNSTEWTSIYILLLMLSLKVSNNKFIIWWTLKKWRSRPEGSQLCIGFFFYHPIWIYSYCLQIKIMSLLLLFTICVQLPIYWSAAVWNFLCIFYWSEKKTKYIIARAAILALSGNTRYLKYVLQRILSRIR